MDSRKQMLSKQQWRSQHESEQWPGLTEETTFHGYHCIMGYLDLIWGKKKKSKVLSAIDSRTRGSMKGLSRGAIGQSCISSWAVESVPCLFEHQALYLC